MVYGIPNIMSYHTCIIQQKLTEGRSSSLWTQKIVAQASSLLLWCVYVVSYSLQYIPYLDIIWACDWSYSTCCCVVVVLTII